MAVTAQFRSNQLIAPSPGTGPGIGGSVMYAPLGTALPTAPLPATLSSAWTDLGYCDETGIRDREERRNTNVFSWGGGLVGNVQESYARVMTIRFLQYLNPNTLTIAYGSSNTTITPATASAGTQVAVTLNALLLDYLCWCFQGFYRNALVMKVLPQARITQLGEVNWTHRAFTMVEATLLAFPDDYNQHAYLYTNDGVKLGSYS
jgi:hypothetical protein